MPDPNPSFPTKKMKDFEAKRGIYEGKVYRTFYKNRVAPSKNPELQNILKKYIQ